MRQFKPEELMPKGLVIEPRAMMSEGQASFSSMKSAIEYAKKQAEVLVMRAFHTSYMPSRDADSEEFQHRLELQITPRYDEKKCAPIRKRYTAYMEEKEAYMRERAAAARENEEASE